jgi:hypothetical protein
VKRQYEEVMSAGDARQWCEEAVRGGGVRGL